MLLCTASPPPPLLLTGPYVEQMVTLLKAPDITAELFVEVLGALANLNIPEFDFLGLARKHDMLSFLAQYAQPGAVDDDILLEVRGVFNGGQGVGFWNRADGRLQA